MAGNHKSGRKPNPDGGLERSKKYTFYVKEYAHTNLDGNIDYWVEDSYFQWFKRKHGSHWQEQVRAFMRWDVKQWKENHHWRCKCKPIGIWQNWKHNRQTKCHACGEYRRQSDRVMDMSPLEKREYYQSLMSEDEK